MELSDIYVQNHLYDLYEKYYERYKNSAYMHHLRRLSGYKNGPIKQEAEDLVQETFLGAFRWMTNYFEQNKQLPSEEIFERVLRTIEINEFRSHIKRLKRNGILVARFDGSQEDDREEASVPIESLNPEQGLLMREYQKQLSASIKRLKPKESAALLAKARGDSDKEIAVLIKERVKKTTHSIIPLARKKLRKYMEKYLNGNRKIYRKGFRNSLHL